MSLFRGAERETLPLLTRVSHVDGLNENEVFEWVLLEVPEEQALLLQRVKTESADSRKVYRSVIEDIQYTLLYVQEAMDALERGAQVAPWTLKQLADRYGRSQARTKFSFDQENTGQLTRRVENGRDQDVFNLLNLRIFDDLIDNQSLLHRCTECHLVFERGRAGQKLCSAQCRNRVTQRRFMEKRKAAKKVFTTAK